jgi:hypothetical protein
MIPQAGCPHVGQTQPHKRHPGLPSRGAHLFRRHKPPERVSTVSG